ncbi:hypothetical protein [Sphingopyxis fribergensis]
MPRRSKYYTFEGIFAEGVLGVFRVIRGFADLRDLADISVPYRMEQQGGPALRVQGHQREESAKHAEDIKNYLLRSDNRFLPEVILSARIPIRLDVARGLIEQDELGLQEQVFGVESSAHDSVDISRRFSGRSMRVQRIRVRRDSIEAVRNDKLFRRIDGNHRLHLAGELVDDPNSPTKYLAPFCMILLGEPGLDVDDYAESRIFHTINSTALRLESEHGLQLLFGQDPAHAMTADEEYAFDPILHLTRLLSDRLQNLPAPARGRFGDRPLTALQDSARNLAAFDPAITETRETLTGFADDLFGALTDISTRLMDGQPSLCSTYGFIELSARVWRGTEGADRNARITAAVQYLDRLGRWLGSQGIMTLLDPVSPSEQLLATFEAAQSRIPKRVFLARWYPAQADPDGAQNKANLRLQQLQQTLINLRQQHQIHLELIDMGTEGGGTFPIHQRMYEAIASSDIIICDLTGQRPNVFVEAGYALKHHEQNRLIFLFEPRAAGDVVPFDLGTFKYVQISEAAEIPNLIMPELLAILRKAGLPAPAA